jgi:hypothetical protein
MTGCLEKVPELSVTPSTMPQAQPANPRLQMNFDSELRSDLLSVRGNIMLPGNSSLAYLMLNATLWQGKKEQFNTKYLLMQIEPNRDYSFEITKNVKIPAGEYDCTLEATGPHGVLAEESRKVSLANPWQESVFEQVPWPVELDEKVSRQKDEEERAKEESNLQREISSDATEKKVLAMKAVKESGSTSAGGSLQASSNMPEGAKAAFMGSITSKKYHLLDCRYALKIKPENRIYFQSVEDAKRQGYLPCKSCSP